MAGPKDGMVFAAQATRWVSLLLAGLGLVLMTACAPTRVSNTPPGAQARPPAPQETEPTGPAGQARPSVESGELPPPGPPPGEVVVGVPLPNAGEPPTVTI